MNNGGKPVRTPELKDELDDHEELSALGYGDAWQQNAYLRRPQPDEPEDDAAAKFLRFHDRKTETTEAINHARAGMVLADLLNLPVAKDLARKQHRGQQRALARLNRSAKERDELEVRIHIDHNVALPRTLLDESDPTNSGRGPLN